MWAQLISMGLKPGCEDGMGKMLEQLRAAEQPGSGLLRQTVMRDQNDPSRYLMLVLFESEEKARERESDPRRQEGMKAMRETMKEIIDGAAQFVDLSVVEETSL
jgi:quinol monooxygenase YgiN